ncbi:MAG: hypothetical protein AABW79_00960 [Nanoarchaeota archaeon]
MKLTFLAFFMLFLFTLALSSSAEINDSQIKDAIDKTLSKEIPLNPELQKFTSALFKTEELSFSLFIILIVLSILSFSVLINILHLTPFFSKGITNIIGAICITLLIAITGAFYDIAVFILGFGETFKFLERWSSGAIIFAIVIIIIVWFVLTKMLKWAKNYSEMEKAKHEGMEVGKELGFLKMMREMFGITRK